MKKSVLVGTLLGFALVCVLYCLQVVEFNYCVSVDLGRS